MQYNGETNNQDICSLADDLADSNSSSFPIKNKTRFANMGMREIWGWIWEAYNGWFYDDSNNTDLPEATATLTADQRQITLPIDSAHLAGVEYKDTSGTWHPVKPITLEQIKDRGYSETEFMKTSGNPTYYRPLANGFILYPPANFTQAASLKVYISRDISTFAITDTTKVPGFPSEFHEAVAVFIALHYKSLAPKKLLRLQNQWDGNEAQSGREGGFKTRIKSFYGSRFRQLFPPRMRTGDPVREYM